MTPEEILKHIDYTLLKPTAEWTQIQKLCEDARKYGMASVCIPPCYVKEVKKVYGRDIRICTVIGFPLGYTSAEAKIAEARQALADGADEIDMVINLCAVKNGNFEKAENEIRALRDAAPRPCILKVIVETCYLTREEKIALCECVSRAGADFIKTSTGFGTGGATLEDVRLFKEYIGPDVSVKASAGIRTLEDMEAFIQAGCSRIGSSTAAEDLLKTC